jgi:hypothetical protein
MDLDRNNACAYFSINNNILILAKCPCVATGIRH